MNLQEREEPPKYKVTFGRRLWLFLFPQTTTKMYVNGIHVATATTEAGPPVVNVVSFLREHLCSRQGVTFKRSVLEDNNLLRSLVNRSLGSKDVVIIHDGSRSTSSSSPTQPQSQSSTQSQSTSSVLDQYIDSLLNECVNDTDLLICAALLQSESLQLCDGRYLQVTKITISE